MRLQSPTWVSSLYISLVYGQDPQVLRRYAEGSLGDGGRGHRARHGSAVYVTLLSMVRTPKYYADTLKDPLVMEDETCARIMEAADEYFRLR